MPGTPYERPKLICSVCEDAVPVWRHKLLLGADDALCFDCFEAWYDGGLTDRADIRARVEARRSHITQGRG